MHLKLQIKHYAAQTDSKIQWFKKKIQQKQIRDKHPEDRLYMVKKENKKKKEYRKMGISRSPDVAQNIHV